MTKISNTGNSFDIWNLLDWSTVNNGEKSKQMQDAVPELKGRKIRIDSLELSKEGMAALRGRVQSMPGRIDMEEMMQMREILPKLKLNPEDDFYWAMREDMQNSLDAIKQSKGNYTLDDMISIRMDAYTRQYNALQKSYEDDSRDIYICDGSNAEGKLQYHKVSKGEDVTFLNQAFDRIADSLGFTANGCESQLKINELFGGQKAPELSLPDNYEEKLSGIMKKAAATYAEQKKNGNNVNATNLALKYLNEDADFSDVMHQLFSNIRPMRILHRNTKLSLFQKAVVKKCMS